MKTTILSTALFCAATFGYGYSRNIQSSKAPKATNVMSITVDDDERPIDNTLVEVPATYPDGDIALLGDIAKNLEYPETAKKHNVQGTVLVRFVIDKKGAVDTVKVEKSLSKECDEAAVAVIKKLKRFTPAVQEGKPVAVWFRLPIRFSIAQ